MLDPSTPVATLVLDHSECAPVFARHRIDYCCNGAMPLVDACRDRGVDVAAVIAELEVAIARRQPGAPGADPRTLSTRELIVKRIAPHHQYLHRTMPFLQRLAAKVARVHGDGDPSLRDLAILVDELVETFGEHLRDEEAVLFPALLAGEVAAVTRSLAAMRHEHEQVGALLAMIRRTAAGFDPPDGACTSYRTLLGELAMLEADTLAHVHLENHVLLPRYTDALRAAGYIA
jgi:regulator of cell morphogenesis and NO signaling